MKRTISFITGQGSVNHNSRKFHAKNTDPKRSHWNVEYCNQDIQEIYHELFDEALERYNVKQTRKDRKIENYYEKIRSGKQEKPFHEIIRQIGNKNDIKQADQYEKKLTEIAPMVKDMERFAEKYSSDPNEVLPEAGTLETGKSYREKKAKPLIKKIVTVLRSVYRAYLDLSRRFSDMQRSYERAWIKVNSLTARVEELWNENRMLRENLGDFERVKGALGHDTIETIVQVERLREQEIKGKMLLVTRNIFSHHVPPSTAVRRGDNHTMNV